MPESMQETSLSLAEDYVREIVQAEVRKSADGEWNPVIGECFTVPRMDQCDCLPVIVFVEIPSGRMRLLLKSANTEGWNRDRIQAVYAVSKFENS